MTNEQTTGDDGKATFELEYGDYTATISKDGYVTKTENIAFRNNHKNFTIEIAEVERIGDYNYVIPLGADTITGTLNIGEQDQYGGYLVDIITSSNPNFVTTDGMNIGDTIVADGFTELVLSDYEGKITEIILIGRENVSIQTVFDDNPHNEVSVLMTTEQLDLSDVVDWSKVVGLGNTGGEYGATLIYEIDSTTHEQTETVATITNGTYYVYATSDDFEGEATVTVTDTNRSFTITLT